MTYDEFHTELGKIMYIEDKGMVDILMASILANHKKLSDPVWITLIGTSSGGKSQLIKPFSVASTGLIHRIDDMTANSMLSGSTGVDGSFLGGIGELGILSMDDLTVLFSKNTEQRAEILSQFRMLYDGRYAKSTGGHHGQLEWEGYLGMIAGSTPSIYRFFGEVADMGERFLSYRMKEYDSDKATTFILENRHTSKEMTETIGALYGEFLRERLAIDEVPDLSPEVMAEIRRYAQVCTLFRTPVHINERTGLVDEFPEPEMPLRVMKQLIPLARSLQLVLGEPLTLENMAPVKWTAYSLVSDKRRSYFRACVGLWRADKEISSRSVSAACGLASEVTKYGLDSLQALGLVRLTDQSTEERKRWEISHDELRKVVMEIDEPKVEDYQHIQTVW